MNVAWYLSYKHLIRWCVITSKIAQSESWLAWNIRVFSIIFKNYFLNFSERRSALALPDFSERRSRSRSLFFFRAPLALALAILGAPLASGALWAALSNTLDFSTKNTEIEPISALGFVYQSIRERRSMSGARERRSQNCERECERRSDKK